MTFLPGNRVTLEVPSRTKFPTSGSFHTVETTGMHLFVANTEHINISEKYDSTVTLVGTKWSRSLFIA